MRRFRFAARGFAARALAAAVLVVVALPGDDAHAFAHIEGAGSMSGGALAYSPGLTPAGAGAQTATFTSNGFGAAWHLLYTDVIKWKCDFSITSGVGAETMAAGVGEAVGGCIGEPHVGVLTRANIVINCPLVGPMAYARVGTVVTFDGVCLADWAGVADISDVTMVFNVLPKPPASADEPITEFIVTSGAFRYRG